MSESDLDVGELLRGLDDPVAVERPSDFDDAGERGRAQRFAAALREKFGVVEAEIGPPKIQDASFFAHFAVPPEQSASGHGLWVRVSNFGRLASAGAQLPGAHGNEDLADLVDSAEWETLLALLSEHAYRYVSQDQLFTEYDGQNGPLIHFYRETRGRLSWWIRFFDWI
ncbi:MAG: hypothetical protein ABIZ57_10760 [Candidatus Limnocylindria bacterium]